MNEIKKKLSTRAPARPSERPRSGSLSRAGRLGKALTSTAGVLVIFPGLVLTLGTYLAITAQRALRESNLELARSRLADQAELVAEHVGAALASADLQLDSIASIVRTSDAASSVAQIAIPLRHLLQGHAGASYVSLSFPDGTFEGAFVDSDGRIRFRKSRVLPEYSLEEIYDYGTVEDLYKSEEHQTKYDPRKRPFYQLAARTTGPVWTEPYAFVDTHETGITRAQAIRNGETLLAVATFDYDVRQLSPMLKHGDAYLGRPILFDHHGAILADPQLRLPMQRKSGPELLTFESAGDPILRAFFSVKPQLSGFYRFEAEGAGFIAAVAPLRDKGRPDWRIAFVAPEATFLAALHTHKKRSVISAALALVAATLLSGGFARMIVRTKREVAMAREAERKARTEARELGSYRLIDKLGEGGMGEVWRAEHRLLARDAAIKLIRTEGRPISAMEKQRFQREAQSLAALRCRNTIELYDYGVSEDGTFFYVMELLDGLDLETLVARTGAVPPYRAVSILMQICSSLAEAHDRGLVHRDIKPANIFLCRVADELDVVKVLDFGLVRSVTEVESSVEPVAAGSSASLALEGVDGQSGERRRNDSSTLTRPDSLLGTPAFMAPEQCTGAEVDRRADIYALGGVAFWLLSGKFVFPGSPMAQIVAHVTEKPPELESGLSAPLPLRLVQLVQSCLAKLPSERPQNARLVRAELELARRELDSNWLTEAHAWWQANVPQRRSPSGPPSKTEVLVRTESDSPKTTPLTG